MRKLQILLAIFFLVSFVGCTQNEKELVRTEGNAIENNGNKNISKENNKELQPSSITNREKETLVWAIETHYVRLDDRILQAIHTRLEELGFPYEIEFVGPGEISSVDMAGEYQRWLRQAKEDQMKIDLINTGMGTYESELDTYSMAVKDDLLMNLDQLINSNVGRELSMHYIDKVWNWFKVEGSLYGIVSRKEYEHRNYFLVNQQYLKETWEENTIYDLLCRLEDAVEKYDIKNKIIEISSKQGPEKYKILDYGMLNNEVTWKETDEGNILFQSPFIDSNNIQLFQKIAQLREKGYAFMESAAYSGGYRGDFLAKIDSISGSALYEDEYSGFYRMQKVSSYPLETPYILYHRNCFTGVTSWSKNQEAAFELMVLINTDEQLSRLMLLGIEGIHYNIKDGIVIENQAEKRGVPNISEITGNPLFLHPTGIEPLDIRSYYIEWNQSLRDNPVLGFNIDWTGMEDMKEVFRSFAEKYAALLYGEFKNVEDTMDIATQEWIDSGLEKAAEEISWQYIQWKKSS